MTAIGFGIAVAIAAPAGADDPVGTEAANPYTGLRCACAETAPADSPALLDEVRRGLVRGHTAVVPGLPPVR